MPKHCNFCHQEIPDAEYAHHVAQHLETRPDGQQQEYPSLPPDLRFQGSLASIPQVYLHPRCGAQTGMPEELIRTYLVDPFFYSYQTFCTGCSAHVSMRELTWVETGQNVAQYMNGLRAKVPWTHPSRFKSLIPYLIFGVGGGLLCGILGLIVGACLGSWLGGLLAGFALGGLVGAGFMYKMRS